MLLNGRLELHGVDAEGLSRRALDDSLRSRGAHLSREEYEDALSFVVSELWRISLDYDPERTASFATYGYRRGRQLAVDWFRLRFGRTKWQFGDGRTHVRERPVVFSIERETGTGGQDPGHHNSGNKDRVTGELARAYAARSSDPADDRSPDLSGILTRGSRQRARDLDELGLEPHGRAA